MTTIGGTVNAEELSVVELGNTGDQRGDSFQFRNPWPSRNFTIKDVHITTVMAGEVRGNHFHRIRYELLLISHEDRWSLYWDTEGGAETHHLPFQGRGAVAVRVPPGISHAIRNDGKLPLRITGLSDQPYDPAAPDSFSRRVSDHD